MNCFFFRTVHFWSVGPGQNRSGQLEKPPLCRELRGGWLCVCGKPPKMGGNGWWTEFFFETFKNTFKMFC